MRVQALAPLATGLVSFRDPEPRASIVLKQAVRIVDGPQPWLALEEQVSMLRGPKVAFDGTAHPDDFAPRKLRTEILVVGCAHSIAPSTQVPVELRLGAALHKRAWVRSPAPATLHPLVPAWVAVEPPVSAWFGPRPLPALAVSPARDAREAAWSESWLELPPGDRGESQQCAAVEQQTWERIGARSQLWLRGLARSADALSLELPSEVPWCMLLLRGRSGAVAAWSELELRLETLHLDATSGLLELTFRGELDVGDFESPPDLVVGVSEGGFAPPRAELEPRLARTPPQFVARPESVGPPPSLARPATALSQPSALSLPPPPPAPWAPPRDAFAAAAVSPVTAPAREPAAVLDDGTSAAGADPETIRPAHGDQSEAKTLPPDALDPSALPFAVAPLPPPPSLSPVAPPRHASPTFEPSHVEALPFVGAAATPIARSSSPSTAGLPFAGAGAAARSLEPQSYVDGSGTVAVKLDASLVLPFRGAASAGAPPTPPPPPADDAAFVDGSATIGLQPARAAALPFQAALGARPTTTASARPAETAGLPFMPRGASQPTTAHPGLPPEHANPVSVARPGDTLPPVGPDAVGEPRLPTQIAPPPRLPLGIEPPASFASPGFRAPLPTLPNDFGASPVLPFGVTEAPDAPTPQAPAVVPAPPFAPQPASLEGRAGSSSAVPRWVAPSGPSEPGPSRQAPRAVEGRRATAERELDAVSLALVRTVAEEARHDTIRALGFTALAYARAEQRHLEELERELSEGRGERLAQLVSALHERALTSDAPT